MIGKLLGGRYEIIEKIGGGGMALVYKAKCTLLNRYVAIKVLRDEFARDQEFVEKFRRESQAAASLSHPNIVNIYDVGTDEDGERVIHYIVMEYIDGKTLKEIVKEEGRLSNERVIDYSIQIANALKAAHNNNIIHRDIKPQNIMINEDNRVKVMDFGIARAATSSTITTTSEALGSVHYFSPEQARGGYTDEKSDIYSLGIVMYEMITGHPPYDGESPITVALKHVQEDIVAPSQMEPSVPKDIEAIILKAVKKRQLDRYLNMDEMLIDLNKLVSKYNVMPASSENKEAEELEEEDDEFKTQVIPIISDDMIDQDEELEPIPKKPKDRSEKSSKKGTIAGIVLAFLLAFGLFFGKSLVSGLFAKAEVEMPNLVGKSLEEAEEILKENKLEYKILARVETDEYPPGIVIKQDVEPGTKLKTGFPVQLTISIEPESYDSEQVDMPNLVGKTLEEARAILAELGLKIGTIKEVTSKDFLPGTIMEQSIKFKAQIHKGENVDLTISKDDPDVENVSMPNLTGKNIDEVKSIVQSLGLTIGSIKEVHSDYDKGIVIWQSYKEATELPKGTSVSLQVSIGRQEEEKPTEPEKPADKSQTFTINASDEGTEIRIDKVINGETTTIYNQVLQGQKKVTVSGPAGATLNIYYDGVLKDSHIL